jgi:hypothetical protein
VVGELVVGSKVDGVCVGEVVVGVCVGERVVGRVGGRDGGVFVGENEQMAGCVLQVR